MVGWILMKILGNGAAVRRWFVLTALFLVLGSCNREIPLEVESREIQGYQIEGRVNDQLSEPVPGVGIYVFLDFELVSQDGSASRDYLVTSGGQVVTVNVYDWTNTLIRTISSGTHEPGLTFQVHWDETDSMGDPVPPGLYSVRYRENGVVKKSYDVVISGTFCTSTDVSGRYVVGNDHLPIGFEPVSLFSLNGDTYYGDFRIGERVGLEFHAAGRVYYRTFEVIKDRVTVFDLLVN